jgi:hypothetical protein
VRRRPTIIPAALEWERDGEVEEDLCRQFSSASQATPSRPEPTRDDRIAHGNIRIAVGLHVPFFALRRWPTNIHPRCTCTNNTTTWILRKQARKFLRIPLARLCERLRERLQGRGKLSLSTD